MPNSVKVNACIFSRSLNLIETFTGIDDTNYIILYLNIFISDFTTGEMRFTIRAKRF